MASVIFLLIVFLLRLTLKRGKNHMVVNESFETGPHKPLVAGSIPAATTFNLNFASPFYQIKRNSICYRSVLHYGVFLLSGATECEAGLTGASVSAVCLTGQLLFNTWLAVVLKPPLPIFVIYGQET
jgi:hypothetical protein